MSRRHILNLTSRKKKDNMISIAVGGSPGAISVATNYTAIFCPTARPLSTVANGTKDQESDRTQSETYARGVKERVNLAISGGNCWRWRRIGFSVKGFFDLFVSLQTAAYARSLTLGQVRPTNVDFSASADYTAFLGYLFDGTQNVDWFDIYNAKVDTDRVKLHYDKTYTFNPGNASGMTKVIKHWHPLNSSLHYGDDENGISESTIANASLGRHGMGDYFIVDFIQRATGAVGDGSAFIYDAETTYYWHER